MQGKFRVPPRVGGLNPAGAATISCVCIISVLIV